MTKRHQILVMLGGIHLLLVLLGSMKVDFRVWNNPAAKVIAWYSAMTGANMYYGFFSPGLEVPYRVHFTMLLSDGTEIAEETLEIGSTTESNLRLKSINFLGVLSEEDSDKQMRSFAGTMFGKHPGAEHVRISMQYFGLESASLDTLGDIPSMAEYRAGGRSEWHTFHQLVLSRHQFYQLNEEANHDTN